MHARKRCPIERLEPRRLLSGVTYQGGRLIDNAAVETVYLGRAWTTDPALQQNAAQLDQFFATVTNSTFMDMLAEYSTPHGGQIGRGSFTGQINLAQDNWQAGTITDRMIRNLLDSEIVSRALVRPSANQVLFVFTPPNVAVTQDGSSSNGRPVGFAGYHDSFVDSQGDTVVYAVIPDPVGNDRIAGLSAFDQQTEASSHELAEAISDPTRAGWWDDTSDLEVADFANPSTDVVYLGLAGGRDSARRVRRAKRIPPFAASLLASSRSPIRWDWLRSAYPTAAPQRSLQRLPLVDERGHQRSPAGLVRGADAGAVVTVKVFVEEQVVAPVWVVLKRFRAAEHRAVARGVALENRHQPLGDLASHFVACGGMPVLRAER